jgi:hypothetical protein
MEYLGYDIVPDGTFGNKLVRPVGGRGRLPKPLRGRFTSFADAKRVIDTVGPAKKKESVKNGTKNEGASESRSGS